MVEETIKTIKEAEQQAESLVSKAEVECVEIIEKAVAEAKKMKDEASKNAKMSAQAVLDKAKAEGEQSTEQALKNVEQEIASLKAAVSKKEDAAIKAVIEALV